MLDSIGLAWAASLGAVLTTSAAHLLFKVGVQSHRRLLVLGGLTGFLVAVALTFAALRRLDVGAVFMLTALTPILTSLGAAAFANERVPVARWAGIALCSFGILVYQFG
ncbi:MAG: EamA family transporter [Hyphomonadaceae bacterium]